MIDPLFQHAIHESSHAVALLASGEAVSELYVLPLDLHSHDADIGLCMTGGSIRDWSGVVTAVAGRVGDVLLSRSLGEEPPALVSQQMAKHGRKFSEGRGEPDAIATSKYMARLFGSNPPGRQFSESCSARVRELTWARIAEQQAEKLLLANWDSLIDLATELAGNLHLNAGQVRGILKRRGSLKK